MPETSHFEGPRSGEKHSSATDSPNDPKSEGTVVVHYDPDSTKKIVLVNSKSGSRREVQLFSEQRPSTQGRQIGGIIGPY